MTNRLNYVITQTKNDNIKNDKTVLFLHGWGGSIHSFLFCQNYIKQYTNTLNVDFYGFGKSDEPNKKYDTYLYALSIYELLKDKNIHKVCIVAHSFGGRVAILLSTIFDIEVESLVLVNSAGVKPKRSIFYYFKIYTYKAVKWLVKHKLIKSKVLKHFGSSDYKHLSNIMKQSFVTIVNQDLTQYLKSIKAKTLIVWGDKDKITPMHMAKTLKHNIIDSTMIIYKNSGHFSYLENYHSFCHTIIKFLKL